jgi:hypothetical protein
MERSYNHETQKHELSLSSAELELVYRGLGTLAGVALIQSSIENLAVDTKLLNEMREFTTQEGY